MKRKLSADKEVVKKVINEVKAANARANSIKTQRDAVEAYKNATEA